MIAGNSSSVIGWVMMVVDTGDSCHSLYELVIMAMAMEKLANTMAIHANLADRDLALEMCARPWMVELSRNSMNMLAVEEVEAYFLVSYLLSHSKLPHKAEPLSTGGNLYQIDSSYFACRNVSLINKILSPDKKRLSMSSN